MMNRIKQCRFPAATWLVAFALAWIALPARAQAPSFGLTMTGFTWPDYYPPPHEAQLRWLLKASEAMPQAGTLFLVRGVTLEKFQETGGRELLIETPICSFDSSSHEVSSASPIKLQLQQGRLTLEGEGFRWEHTNSLLMVSNKVQTTLQGGQGAEAAGDGRVALPTLGQARITADHFRYSGVSGEAVYRGNVRVASTNLGLASQVLTFQLPTGTNGTIEDFAADEDVAIDSSGLHATGDRAVIRPGEGALQLTGRTTWQALAREGSGDELRFSSASMTLQVAGQARLKFPVSGAGLLFQPPGDTAPAPPQPGKERFAVITSGRYEIQTNRAGFHGDVHATEWLGAEAVSRMVCGELNVELGMSNQLQNLVAERDVVIEQGERRLTAGRARFNGVTGVGELTDQPTWRDGERSGQGAVLVADLRRNQFAVRTNALLLLPPTDAGSLLGVLVPNSDRTKVATKPRSAAAAPTRVTSDEYELSAERLVFRGQVRVDGAQIQLTCGVLDMKLAPGGTNVVGVVAEQNVVMSLVESNVQWVATCARAVYTATNEVLDLAGQPVLQRMDAATTNTFTGESVWLNRLTGTVSSTGYRASLPAVGGTTNPVVLPFQP